MKKGLISLSSFLVCVSIPLVMLALQNRVHAQVFTDATFNNTDWSHTKIAAISSSGSTVTAAQDNAVGHGNPLPSRLTTHTYPMGHIYVAHLSNASTYDPATQGAIVTLSYSYDLINYTTGQVAYYPLLFQNNIYYVHIPNDLTSGTVWTTFGGPTRSNLTAASFVNVANQSGNEHPDFSCTGSKIVFGYVTRNHNPISTTATTRSGIDNWKVSIDEKRSCCGTISAPQLTCDRGVFTYTFTVANNSTQVIQYLLLAPAAGATFSVSPNVINLGGTPLNPGQSTTVSVTITNASPGDQICINVALADKALITCCTIQSCVQLPECPCLRLAETSIACGANGSYTYNVAFQNLTGVPVQQIFIVPTQPSTLNVSPQLVTLSAPLLPNQSTTLTITITGAPPGTNICLRFSPLGDNAATCCSIERCLTLPTCHPNPADKRASPSQ